MPSSPDSRILATLIKHAQQEEVDPLTPLIDSYLLRRENPKYAHLLIRNYTIDVGDRPRPSGRISPSSAGGCEREATFKFLGVRGRRRIDPELQLIFEDGKWRHHKWQFMFREMERFFPDRFKVISIEEDVSIERLFSAGSLDAIIKIKVNGKWVRYVVDFKGANSFAFDDAYRTRRPNPKYVLQLLTYMKAKGCKRGILLYDSKNTNKIQPFHVKYTDVQWAEVSRWHRRVINALKSRKLPPKHPDCNNGTFLYNRCPYRGLCFGNKGAKEIERRVFKKFPGVDELWEQGNLTIRSHKEQSEA